MESNDPIRPMSWYCGSQLTTTVESSASREDTIVFMLWVNADHGIITPFGEDVLPDVYCRKHSWSGVKWRANSSRGERSKECSTIWYLRKILVVNDGIRIDPF